MPPKHTKMILLQCNHSYVQKKTVSFLFTESCTAISAVWLVNVALRTRPRMRPFIAKKDCEKISNRIVIIFLFLFAVLVLEGLNKSKNPVKELQNIFILNRRTKCRNFPLKTFNGQEQQRIPSGEWHQNRVILNILVFNRK